MADTGEFDDVPPLEDMSEMMEHLQVKHKPVASELTNKPMVIHDEQKEKEDTKPAPKTDSASFGGLKKGFLFSGGTKAKNVKNAAKKSGLTEAADKEEITLIKPDTTTDNPLRLPEVQQAMDASQAMLNNKDQWLTEDLLHKVTQSPRLSKHFSDPHFMQALTEFQSNPTAAMAKYGRNPEMQMFLKEFCGLMGDHLSGLPDTPKPSVQTSQGADISVRQSTDPKQPTTADQEKINSILADPRIKDILQDPRIQRLFEVLRTDPNKARSVLRTTDPEMRSMIRTLCDVGLLQLQS